MIFTIVGQGLAGTWVALTLQRAGHHVRIVDPQRPTTSSRVAAGIINPITGQRLKPTWRGEQLIPHARDAFRSFETLCASFDPSNASSTVWRDIELRHAFRSSETMQWFERRASSGELNNMRLTRIEAGTYEGMAYPHGGCIVHDAAIVDVASFLDKGRAALLRQGAELLRAEVSELTVNPTSYDSLNWSSTEQSDMIIWCTGIDALKHALWSWLTLEPSKGEMLEVELRAIPDDLRRSVEGQSVLPYILNSGTWIAPLVNGRHLVGATNDWDDHEAMPTQAARTFLMAEVMRMTGCVAELIEHRVAIRPSTLRKRPLIGVHPVDSRHAVLTGLGSKGCLLAPWAAQHMADHLLSHTPLDEAVDIQQDFKP